MMSKLYACIISADLKRNRDLLISAAREFSYSIEVVEDGIIFDVSGLGTLIGTPADIASAIFDRLKKLNIIGSLAVADTIDSACLLARRGKGAAAVNMPDGFSRLPLADLPIGSDTLGVFEDLGIRRVEDLLAVPHEELVGRYGQDFRKVIDMIEQKGSSMLTPNVKENKISWAYDLDLPVEDFEQLIFLLNRGFDPLFTKTAAEGKSTEHLTITLGLRSKAKRSYEIRTSFPTLEMLFWLKLVNLRISLDPPEAEILSVGVTLHFTKPRPAQRGLYAVSRPEPESLLLTANKLKKLVGEDNVGVPVILDQRLAEPFELDHDALPKGIEGRVKERERPVIAFTYYRPPQRADVVPENGRLVFIRTRSFAGHVREYSGVWKANSRWWNRGWKLHEWDVEINDGGIYRLCRANKEWFVTGEYD
jgi:protein ImuB